MMRDIGWAIVIIATFALVIFTLLNTISFGIFGLLVGTMLFGDTNAAYMFAFWAFVVTLVVLWMGDM